MSLDDELERELEALRPRPASPGMRRCIRGRLSRRRWFAVTAVGAIAAGVVVVLLMNWPGRHSPDMVIGPPVIEQMPAPSLLAYQRAAARSPESLDDLLDRQAVRSGWNDPAGRANSDFVTLRGIRP